MEEVKWNMDSRKFEMINVAENLLFAVKKNSY